MKRYQHSAILLPLLVLGMFRVGHAQAPDPINDSLYMGSIGQGYSVLGSSSGGTCQMYLGGAGAGYRHLGPDASNCYMYFANNGNNYIGSGYYQFGPDASNCYMYFANNGINYIGDGYDATKGGPVLAEDTIYLNLSPLQTDTICFSFLSVVTSDSIVMPPLYGPVIPGAQVSVVQETCLRYVAPDVSWGQDTLSFSICNLCGDCVTGVLIVRIRQVDTVYNCNIYADTFAVRRMDCATSYNWIVPAGATYNTLPGDTSIVVNWYGTTPGPDSVGAYVSGTCSDSNLKYFLVFIKECCEIDLNQAVVTASNTTACNLTDGNLLVSNAGLKPSTAYKVYYTKDGGTATGPLSISSSVTGDTLTLSGLDFGSYTNLVIEKITDNTCKDTLAGPYTISQPAPPAAPSVTVMHPTCALSTGTLTVTDPLGVYDYSLDGDPFQSSVTFLAVSAGLHNLRARSTANYCISSSTSVTVNDQPLPPAAPSVTIIHPTCDVSTGNLTVTAPLGTYDYSLDGGTFQSSVTFLAVSAGLHNVRARSTADNTCISLSTPVTVNTQPSAPSAPTVIVVHPTCAVTTGTLTVATPLGAYDYSLDGGTFQSSVTFLAVSAGLHNVRARSTADNTCISLATPVTVNAQPSAPSAPTVTVAHPTCAVSTGTLTVTAPLGAYDYSLDGGVFQSSVTFSAVSAGSHNVIAWSTLDNTCISAQTPIIVNSIPENPVLGGDTEVCVSSTANVTPSSGGSWSSSNNLIATVNNSGIVSGLVPGSVTLTYTRDVDGCSNSLGFVVVAMPSVPVFKVK